MMTLMKNLFVLLSACVLFGCSGNETVYKELDKVLEQREQYISKKEKKLDSLERKAAYINSETGRLECYNELFNEYFTFRFDSAMVYVDRMAGLSEKTGNRYYKDLTLIHKTSLLATGGLYWEAIENMKKIDFGKMDKRLLYDYYISYMWTYNYCSGYAANTEYYEEYSKMKTHYIHEALKVADKGSDDYQYLYGEYLFSEGRYEQSNSYYLKGLENLGVNTRLYAMITYGLARNYKILGNEEKYIYYLVRAAVSDNVCPLKENLAMQELSIYLYTHYPDEIKRANTYINYSLDDARFYNNRLRIVEISKKFPDIIRAYQKLEKRNTAILRTAAIIISLSAVCLIVALIFIRKQRNTLYIQRGKLLENNKEMARMNRQLIQTNTTREGYVHLFLDLCAAYIDKLRKYKELARRKILAGQVNDLLKTTNSIRLTENEATEFFTQFDTAFMELYPDFIEQFNSLLKEEYRINVKHKGQLTTELRIHALIRLGIKESSEIATLLFYSPQTIYNYRSSVKSKAVSRETFETDLMNLCTLI